MISFEAYGDTEYIKLHLVALKSICTAVLLYVIVKISNH